jgi:FtsH-binding integral membrane protein
VSYWYSCIGALIFSGWILFDTSAVTRQYYQENNVPGAVLMLYVDILNLFLFLLRILSNRSDD